MCREAVANHILPTVKSSPLHLIAAGIINNPIDIDWEQYGVDNFFN